MDRSPQRRCGGGSVPVESSTHAPNVFFALLRQAGKPASLHITKFDLPESYGIVDASYRMEKMSHVRKYRLASASRAMKRAEAIGTFSEHTTPLRTAATSLAPSVKEVPLIPSTVSTTISPIMPTFAPIPFKKESGTGIAEPESQCVEPSETHKKFWMVSLEPFSLDKTVVDIEDNMTFSAADALPLSCQRTLTTLLRGGHSRQSRFVPLDPPESIRNLRNQMRHVLPLTETNVQLLRQDPSDPQTGESLLRGARRVDLVRKWFPHVEMNGVSIDSGAAAHHPDAQNLKKVAHGGPTIQFKRESPQRGAKHSRSSAFITAGDVSVSNVSDIFPCGEEVLESGTEKYQQSLHHQSCGLMLQRPFDHINPSDILAPLLQLAHFIPAQFPRKSWLRQAMSTEQDMLEASKRLEDASLSFVGNVAGGGAVAALRAANLPPSEQSGTTSMASEVVSDPSILFQRMLSVSVSENDLVSIRAEMLVRQHSNGVPSAIASPLGPPGATHRGPADESRLGADSPASPSGGHRRLSDVAQMIISTREPEDSHVTAFADVVKLALKNSGSKPKSECRLQLKVGNSPSHCIRFNRDTPAVSPTFTVGSSKKKPCNLPQLRGDCINGRDDENARLCVPRAVLDSLPPNIATVLSADKKIGTIWNSVFQYWMGILHSPANAPQAIRAHQQLVHLQRAFIEQCGSFVEDHLLDTIIHQVQVVVGGVLFSLMPSTEDDNRHHKSLRMDLGPVSSTIFTSVDVPDQQDPARAFMHSLDDDDGAGQQRTDSMDDTDVHKHEVESNQKMASAHIRNVTAVHENWYKSFFADEVASSPCSLDEGLALLAPANAITSVSEEVSRALKGKHKASGNSRREDGVAFPLACVVRYLGFVVSCTARMPPSVERTSQPASKHPDVPATLAATLSRELGVSPYMEHCSARDNGTEMKKRVDGSRHLLYGFCSPADEIPMAPSCYITALPTFMPPLIPTMRYRRHLRLRAEFTSHLSDTIPSDLFSSSASTASFPEKATAQAAAVKIARKLLHKSVTDLVQCWERRCSEEPLCGDAMCTAMHNRGINMSLLGYLGDMVHQKVKSLVSLKANRTPEPGSRPTSAGQEEEGDDAFGHKLDALEKTLRTVKEEMAVRAFRAHCNTKFRDICLAVKGDVKLISLQYRMTLLIKQLLGNESDPLVSTFWSSVITPYVRDKFHFRAPLGRKDLSLRTTLRRLESLCGFVLSPGTPKDALNAVMLHKHEDLLSLELRNTRAIAIGSVVELRPYIKAPPPPFLPPLWLLPEADILGRNGGPVVAYLEEEEKRANAQLGDLSNYSHHLRTRRIEVMLAQGEQNSEKCEAMLVQSVVQSQAQVVPLYHRATEGCLMLSRMYLAVHRNLDAARCADDAVSVALAIPQSQYQTMVAALFATLFAAAKESGSREQAIHALERSIAACVRRLAHLAGDPYHIAQSWEVPSLPPTTGSATLSAFLSVSTDGDKHHHADAVAPRVDGAPQAAAFVCPVRRQVLFEQTLLFNSIQTLTESYKAMSYHTLDAPLPFHESVVSPQFLQFLFDVGSLKVPKPLTAHIIKQDSSTACCIIPLCHDKPFPSTWTNPDVTAAKCIFTRALHLAEILQLKAVSGGDVDLMKSAGIGRESQVLSRCRENLEALREL